MELHIKRRELVVALGGAAGSLIARAQPALPIIGFLSSTFAKFLKAFQQGLSEQSFVEARNVAIEYRWAEGHLNELDGLAAELVSKRVTLIAATGGVPSARAAQNATATIPIVFVGGFDPVKAGLVASFNKPSGNITGVTIVTTELATKRLGLLYDLDPGIRNAALLVNPGSVGASTEIENVVAAAKTTGRPIVVLKAGSEVEIDAALASATKEQVRGLIISADPFFMTRRAQILRLVATYRLPVVYPFREFVDDGGLMSYGPNLASGYRTVGIYAGRILKGAKPSELPIEAPTRFELVINLKTARALSVAVPEKLLATADETVE
jgi:putative tryptophan/tyrosine transport system substrate-binding protein